MAFFHIFIDHIKRILILLFILLDELHNTLSNRSIFRMTFDFILKVFVHVKLDVSQFKIMIVHFDSSHTSKSISSKAMRNVPSRLPFSSPEVLKIEIVAWHINSNSKIFISINIYCPEWSSCFEIFLNISVQMLYNFIFQGLNIFILQNILSFLWYFSRENIQWECDPSSSIIILKSFIVDLLFFYSTFFCHSDWNTIRKSMMIDMRFVMTSNLL